MTLPQPADPAMPDEEIERLIAGLEGVTPGKWIARPDPRGNVEWEVIKENPDDASDPWFIAMCFDSADGATTEALARHFARCSPDAIARLLSRLTVEITARKEAEGERDEATKRANRIVLDQLEVHKKLVAAEARAVAAEARIAELVAHLTCVQQQCETAVYNLVQREHDAAVVRSFQSIADYAARTGASQ